MVVRETKKNNTKNINKKISTNDLLTISQLSSSDITLLLKVAKQLKVDNYKGKNKPLLKGKVLAAIFEKSSTRTRVSFETAMYQLGGTMLYLAARDLQLERGETIADTAKVLSRYVQGIVIRTDKHAKVEELAEQATVPVINALTDEVHPCQILADLFTLKERFGKLAGLRIAYVGDGNNVARSLVLGAAKTGMHLYLASPPGYEIDKATLKLSEKYCLTSKGIIKLMRDPRQAVNNTQVIYTDAWISMGQEKEKRQRLSKFKRYQVNTKLMSLASSKAVFMHCLPAHREQEVTSEVMDSKQSIIFDQAENRLHMQKAILLLLLGQVKG